MNSPTKKTFISEQAKEFRTTYNLENSRARPKNSYQKNLIVEEFKEFLEADGFLFKHGNNVQEECLKELADLVYVCYQYAENMRWDLDEALNRVHESNMSKLDEDGKPIYRKDGKVLKGPNYKPPNLEDLV
jgi:predicted HAD superfamily Cof-like phosphohydrolase